jgi:hypothetical protein
MIELLKNQYFSWTREATKSFKKLEEALCTNLLPNTPEFTKTFIVECDGLGNGIGAVLMK